MSGLERLDALLSPDSVAVIGATATKGKLGHTVLRNLIGRFTGRVVPVNPSYSEIEGLPCAATIGEAQGPIDCAMIVIPAPRVPAAVQDCADAGVRSVVIGAAGFAEAGTTDGRRRQAEIAAIAAQSGMRILGPNTNGFYNASAGLSLGYNGTHAEILPTRPISILSHSGALFGSVARCLTSAGSGIEKFVAVGNEADIGLLDLFETLIDDPATDVIGLVAESLSDGLRFRRLAGVARDAGKPVVVLKVGRSRAGAEASLAHSSRLAGSARAYAALFQAAGVGVVPSPEALGGACALLAESKPRRGASGVVCVSTSGAGGALLADHAEERGVGLAGKPSGGWSDSALNRLSTVPGGKDAPRNPIDVGTLGDWTRLAPILSALASVDADGPLVAFAHSAPRPGQDEILAQALVERRRAARAPVLVAAPGGLGPHIEGVYAGHAIPVFQSLATALDSIAPWSRIAESLPDEIPPLPDLTTMSFPAGRQVLDERESAELLRAAGIPMVPGELVGDPDAAADSASDLGFPVALKALAPGVVHKMKLGHVALDLVDAAEVQLAATGMAARLVSQGYRPDAVPLLVQPMMSGKVELIVGTTFEAPLGHFLLVGLGGSMTELLDRTLLLPTPISRAAIDRFLAGSWLAPVLASVSGERTGRVADVLEKLQLFVLQLREAVRSIDINPLLIREDDCIAVDAAICLAGESAEPKPE